MLFLVNVTFVGMHHFWTCIIICLKLGNIVNMFYMNTNYCGLKDQILNINVILFFWIFWWNFNSQVTMIFNPHIIHNGPQYFLPVFIVNHNNRCRWWRLLQSDKIWNIWCQCKCDCVGWGLCAWIGCTYSTKIQ